MKFQDENKEPVVIKLNGLSVAERRFYREMRRIGFDRHEVNVMLIGIVIFKGDYEYVGETQ